MLTHLEWNHSPFHDRYVLVLGGGLFNQLGTQHRSLCIKSYIPLSQWMELNGDYCMTGDVFFSGHVRLLLCACVQNFWIVLTCHQMQRQKPGEYWVTLRVPVWVRFYKLMTRKTFSNFRFRFLHKIIEHLQILQMFLHCRCLLRFSRSGKYS